MGRSMRKRHHGWIGVGVWLALASMGQGQGGEGQEPASEEASVASEEAQVAESTTGTGVGELTASTATSGGHVPEAREFVVSQGQPMEVAEAGFTITPPEGWEVYRDFGGATLHMQVPHDAQAKYQRAIQVLRFAEPRFVDSLTVEEFRDLLIKKITDSSGSVQDFQVRSDMVVDLTPDLKGILYYTQYAYEGVRLMQVHVLVSSATNHYLMTYTDLAEFFESDDNPNLSTAWKSLTSIVLDSRGPTRADLPVQMILLALGLVAIVAIGSLWRRQRAAREYDAFATASQPGPAPHPGTREERDLAGDDDDDREQWSIPAEGDLAPISEGLDEDEDERSATHQRAS